MLRRKKYQGEIVMLSADDSPPVDRPNLSKDYLAGAAPEDWLPLRPSEFYRDNGIDLRLGAIVDRIDLASRQARIAGGESVPFDRLLLATGAEPVRPSIPGASSQIFVLRSLADCRAIIERARTAKTVLVLGASFIGLEVAASLRAREIEVHVATPDKTPMERILGHERWESSFGPCMRSMVFASISARLRRGWRDEMRACPTEAGSPPISLLRASASSLG
jgi:apoptosis-inducing factor 3